MAGLISALIGALTDGLGHPDDGIYSFATIVLIGLFGSIVVNWLTFYILVRRSIKSTHDKPGDDLTTNENEGDLDT